MARRTQRDFSRQMSVLQWMAVVEEGYTLVEFSTEEWAGGTVFVKRVRQPNHVKTMGYREAFVVGPRGAVKTLYSNFASL